MTYPSSHIQSSGRNGTLTPDLGTATSPLVTRSVPFSRRSAVPDPPVFRATCISRRTPFMVSQSEVFEELCRTTLPSTQPNPPVFLPLSLPRPDLA